MRLRVYTSFIMAMLLCAQTSYAVETKQYKRIPIGDEQQPVANKPIQGTVNQCIYVESASMYRHCVRRRYETKFEQIPAVTSTPFKDGPAPHIKDVEALDPYLVAIQYAVRNDFFDLFRKSYFFPDKEVTRDEFVKMVVESHRLDTGNVTTNCFGDIRLSDNPKQVCLAKKKGWLDNNMKFSPTTSINRASAAKILISSFRAPDGFGSLEDNYYDDVSEGTWFARYVNEGRKRNIFPNVRRFDPGLPLTRKEASLWIYNLARAKEAGVPLDTEIIDMKGYVESTLLTYINESRMNFGKTQLKFDEELYDLALAHSQKMSKESSLTHGNMDLYLTVVKDTYDALGENIATVKITGSSDLSTAIKKIHTDMMNEPKNESNHRSNILGENYAFTHTAIAVYEDKVNGRLWITELFAKKKRTN